MFDLSSAYGAFLAIAEGRQNTTIAYACTNVDGPLEPGIIWINLNGLTLTTLLPFISEVIADVCGMII